VAVPGETYCHGYSLVVNRGFGILPPMNRQALAQVVRGFCMGAADVVPGVSGGTVAFVLGIYERLVATIRDGARALGRAARLDRQGFVDGLRAVDWAFLLPLLAGIGLAIVSLAHLIEQLLDDHPVQMAGLFFGLVLGSIAVALRHVETHGVGRYAVMATAGAVTFLVLGLRSGPAEDPNLAFVFLGGVIAVCAMILPGISGSFLLLMLGLYDHVLGLVNDRVVVDLGVFTLGAVLGLASFSSLLSWLLARYHDTVIAALIGIMVGSLRVLWPWPDGTETTELSGPAGEVLAPVLLGIAALAVVVLVDFLARRADEPLEEPADIG
jgi:putative membrane protein